MGVRHEHTTFPFNYLHQHVFICSCIQIEQKNQPVKQNGIAPVNGQAPVKGQTEIKSYHDDSDDVSVCVAVRAKFLTYFA